MTPQDKKELKFVLQTVKDIVLFMSIVIIAFVIVVNVFL
jgi:hypothetical protein